LPWIDSPLKYANGDDLYFHPREEASLIELAFDLFFVANLATFTAYHGIIDMDTLGAYIGFFTIIWFTWLQVTLHDVRFAVDSFYERVCKGIQFVVFVGFALVGYKFEPQMRSENSITYETLCFVLFVSRILFTVQYSTVLVYVTATHSTLVKPLLFLVATFVISSITFLAMIIASHTGSDYDIYYLWYAICAFEAVSVLFISAKWKPLSFKKTHLAERMGLLSMIVIGEGVIGTTKTVGKVMGKEGPDIRSVIQVVLLVTILIFLWQLYFDNHPNGHHIDDSGKMGTIREVIWTLLHYPLHLSFVAIEEGSQQLTLAWEVWHNFQKFQSILISTCADPRISGLDLTKALNASIYKFKFDSTLESNVMVDPIKKSLQEISNYSLPCN
ncbi:bacterial low temperature requirement A protein-domain-containing protein, partial [Tricladium varicosporioides]